MNEGKILRFFLYKKKMYCGGWSKGLADATLHAFREGKKAEDPVN